MATKKISDYSLVGSPANTDLLLQDDGSNYNSLSLDKLSEFVLRSSDYTDVVETRTADHDYTSAELEPDHRVFVDVTSGDITLGLFNGSDRDGSKVVLEVVGTGTNKCYLELFASGTTSHTLEIDDSIIFIWDDTNSTWQIIFDKGELKRLGEKNSSLTLFQNKKYYIEGLQLELTLPDDGLSVGDIIEIFTNDPCNIIQGDAENSISYLNKYFTTKGTSGYLNLKSKDYTKLMYLGAGGNRIEPGIKLSDPATLPTGFGYGVSFSPDNTYLAVAHNTSPYVTIYKRSGDTFTKLSDPATLPAGASQTCAFSPDNTYLSVGHGISPYITIYKRSGDAFTKLSDPATLPVNSGICCSFSPDNVHLVIGQNASPYIVIYKRNGDVFTKLSDPATLPTGVPWGVSFSPDGVYLAVGHGTTPYITIYKRSGDAFTKLADPAILPASNGKSCAFSPDGQYVSVGIEASPNIATYKRSGDTFTKLSDPATLPATQIEGCAYSSDGVYLALSSLASPYITIYKNLESANKVWQVLQLNTLYPDQLEYQFK